MEQDINSEIQTQQLHNEVENLLEIIEINHPEIAQKAKNAQNYEENSQNYEENSQDYEENSQDFSLYLYKILRTCLFANPSDYHGKAKVSQYFAENLRNTAKVMSVSNFINVLFTSPLIYYFFSPGGAFLAFLATLGSCLGLQAFCNITSATVARRTSQNKFMPLIAAFGLILINGTLTIGSGIGSELINNQNAIAETYSKKKVDEYFENLKKEGENENPIYISRFEELSQECNQEEIRLKSAKIGSPEANEIHLSLYGTYEQRQEWNNGKDLSKIDPNAAGSLPTCHAADAFKYLANKDRKKKHQEYINAIEIRNKLGSDLEFLKTEAKPIYQNNFTERGELKNGNYAIQIALLNILTNIKTHQFDKLGFSLFLFTISTITSLTACFLAISLSYLPEAEETNSKKLEGEIDRLLNYYMMDLQEKHRQEKQLLLNQLNLEKIMSEPSKNIPDNNRNINQNSDSLVDPTKYDELKELDKIHDYQKRLLMYFTEYLEEQGVNRRYATIFKTAETALLENISSPKDLYIRLVSKSSQQSSQRENKK